MYFILFIATNDVSYYISIGASFLCVRSAYCSYKSIGEKTFGRVPLLTTSSINKEGRDFLGLGSMKTSTTRCSTCSVSIQFG
jgi:hypothetical protein